VPKELVTSLQAEYLVEARKYEKAKREFEMLSKRMERLALLLTQDEKLRNIRDRKYEQQSQ